MEESKTKKLHFLIGTWKGNGKGKGKIAIPFHSEEDFNRIIKLING
jgi:hypothetical protein